MAGAAILRVLQALSSLTSPTVDENMNVEQFEFNDKFFLTQRDEETSVGGFLGGNYFS
jgi:hypothetical protein